MIRTILGVIRDMFYGAALTLILFGLAVLFFKAGIMVQG